MKPTADSHKQANNLALWPESEPSDKMMMIFEAPDARCIPGDDGKFLICTDDHIVASGETEAMAWEEALRIERKKPLKNKKALAIGFAIPILAIILMRLAKGSSAQPVLEMFALIGSGFLILRLVDIERLPRKIFWPLGSIMILGGIFGMFAIELFTD